MLRSGRALPALLLALFPSVTAATPIQITGRVLDPPRDVQVELRPFSESYGEALRRLKGEAVPPIASLRPRPDGSFALQAPDTGFYSVVVRAPRHLALEHFVHFAVEDTEVPPVELPPASPLEIRAVGADGKPLAGVTIRAVPQQAKEGDWRAADRSAVTGAEGKAVFPRSQGEALTLVVTTPGLYGTASTSPSESPQTVRFPAPRSRTVDIRGPGGKPAAGALVRLARRGWPFGLAGEDGRIALPIPEKNEIGLYAEDSKGLRIEVVMTVAAGEGTDVPVVALRSPTPVSGRVLDASSREPIPGALVWNGGTAWIRAGAGGAFELRAPSGERGRVEAGAPGRTRSFHRWSRNENGAITLLLSPAASIAGHVVDEGGRPVAGAQVRTFSNPDFADPRIVREEKRAWTGDDGRFVLRQLPAGRPHSLVAVREGYAPAHQPGDSSGPVRLILRRGTAAAGRVVDDQGVPVAGAELRLTLAEEQFPGPELGFEARSDSGGRFRFPNVSAGRFVLQASRSGFAATSVPGILIPEREPQVDLGEVTLLPGGAIEGIVVDERGGPVQGAAVILTPLGTDGFLFFDPATRRLPVETGPDGRFRIADLPRGRRVGLQVSHQELASVDVPGVEVPTLQPLRVQLARPRTLEGRVTDPQGEPVAGARVFSSAELRAQLAGSGFSRSAQNQDQGVTDQEGRFVLSGLKPGTIKLNVSASRYRTRQTEGIQIPEEGQAAPVEITLEPGTFLEGQVLDSRGLPARRASVHLQAEDRNIYRMPAMADEEGRYEVGDLEPGPYEIKATAQGNQSFRTMVQIRPGGNRLDLRLPAGTEISGRVVDSQGSPVPGASVSLRPLDEDMMGPFPGTTAVSAANGSFVIPSVPDGEYRVIGSRRGFAAASLSLIRVAGAPVSSLELRLGPAAAIRGRLLGIGLEEARKARVSAHSEEGIHLQGVVNPSGDYRIDDVAPGAWMVMAHLDPSLSTNGTVEVSPGEEAVLDLEFPAGHTLTGRVLLDRAPLSGADVVLRSTEPESPAGGHRTTAHDGTFRLDRLPAGSYTLMIAVTTGVGHAQTLELNGDRDLLVEIETGMVQGRLLSPEGLPVAGGVVSLTGEDPELQASFQGPAARSDEQGLFELPRVAAGTYTATVNAEGFAPAESRVVVTPGGIVHVEIALQPGKQRP